MAEQEQTPSDAPAAKIAKPKGLAAVRNDRERNRWKAGAADRRMNFLILNAPDNAEFHAIVARARNGSKPLDVYEIAEFGLMGLENSLPGEIERIVARYSSVKRRGQMSIPRSSVPKLAALCAATGVTTRQALIACTAYGASEVVRRRSAMSFTFIETRLREAWSNPNTIAAMADRGIDPASVDQRLARLDELRIAMKDGSKLPELTALLNDVGLNSLDVLFEAYQASVNANDRELVDLLLDKSTKAV
jgi:hypothetical protein